MILICLPHLPLLRSCTTASVWLPWLSPWQTGSIYECLDSLGYETPAGCWTCWTQLPRYNTKYWLDTFPDLTTQKSPSKINPLKKSYPAKIAPTAEMNHSGELNPRIATLWNRSRPSLKIIYIRLCNIGPWERNIDTNINHGNFWFIITVLTRHVKTCFGIYNKLVFISNFTGCEFSTTFSCLVELCCTERPKTQNILIRIRA